MREGYEEGRARIKGTAHQFLDQKRSKMELSQERHGKNSSNFVKGLNFLDLSF